MANRFDNELNGLNLLIVKMASMTENSVELLSEAMSGKRRNVIESITEKTEEIEKLTKEGEASCVNLLLRFHPVAGDLRLINSATKIISDLERISDNSLDSAEVMAYITDCSIYSEISLDKMCLSVKKMVEDAVQSYVEQNPSLARLTLKMDDEVDSYFLEAKRKLIALIRNNSPLSEEAPDLMMLAKYLERMGDHAASISKWVLYESGTV